MIHDSPCAAEHRHSSTLTTVGSQLECLGQWLKDQGDKGRDTEAAAKAAATLERLLQELRVTAGSGLSAHEERIAPPALGVQHGDGAAASLESPAGAAAAGKGDSMPAPPPLQTKDSGQPSPAEIPPTDVHTPELVLDREGGDDEGAAGDITDCNTHDCKQHPRSEVADSTSVVTAAPCKYSRLSKLSAPPPSVLKAAKRHHVAAAKGAAAKGAAAKTGTLQAMMALKSDAPAGSTVPDACDVIASAKRPGAQAPTDGPATKAARTELTPEKRQLSTEDMRLRLESRGSFTNR